MSEQTTGFLRTLFDLKFDNLVTVKVVKFVYVLVLIVATLYYIAVTIVAFRVSSALGAVWLLIVGPIAFLVYVVLWRLLLELVIAVFKISENTSKLVTGSAVGALTPSTSPTAASNEQSKTRCPKCQEEVGDSSRFCRHCGTAIVA